MVTVHLSRLRRRRGWFQRTLDTEVESRVGCDEIWIFAYAYDELESTPSKWCAEAMLPGVGDALLRENNGVARNRRCESIPLEPPRGIPTATGIEYAIDCVVIREEKSRIVGLKVRMTSSDSILSAPPLRSQWLRCLTYDLWAFVSD